MENLMQDIENMISEHSNQINGKILGINYLEKLKYNLIDNLKISQFQTLEEIRDQEIEKQYGNNHLLIKIETFPESVSKMKSVIQYNHLCIILSGLKNFEIYDNLDKKKTFFINLSKFEGIVLTKETIINEKISKKTLLINIFDIIDNVDIEI